MRSANLEINDLLVNEFDGDFEFVMGGSSQLKTYPINLLLNENDNAQLLGNVHSLWPEKNLTFHLI